MPAQAVKEKLLPVSDKYIEYAKEVAEQLNEQDVRVEVDARNEKLGEMSVEKLVELVKEAK